MTETPIEPVPDTSHGPWLPGYRGLNVHGGPDSADYEPMESGYDTAPGLIDYEDAPADVAPIAVKVVSDPKPREITRQMFVRGYVDTSPRVVLGQNLKRKAASIRNDGPADIYISHDSSVSPMTGYKIAANASGPPITTQEEIWGVADTTSANLSLTVDTTVEI